MGMGEGCRAQWGDVGHGGCSGDNFSSRVSAESKGQHVLGG